MIAGIFIIAIYIIFQTAPTSVDLLALLSDASGPALLAVIVFGAIREWWVPGKTHRRMVEERDTLLKLALRGTTLTERTVRASEAFATTTEASENDNA